jgi:nucleobase:cation symporter-1, NCS1 family
LCALATLATATVFARLGWGSGNVTKVSAFLVVAAVVMLAGVAGFDLIMKLQTWLTVALAILTIGYVALTFTSVHWSTVSALPSGSVQSFVGAMVFAFSGFGLGWVNSGGDYSRYLPRGASPGGVIGWTLIGAGLAPIVLVFYGLLLAGSNPDLSKAIGNDPIGALTTVLPTWYLVPFALVAIGGLIGGAILDIYSSGLTLLSLGLRIPRWQAASVDGVLMIIGTVYMVWIADSFFLPFQGFLITLGVPLAAWCGVFLADLWGRKGRYHEAGFYDPAGSYGAFGIPAIAALIVGTLVGWGLVTNGYADWLKWQGYLLGPLGLGGRDGGWAFANLGVLAALVIGALCYLLIPDRRQSVPD